MDYRTCYGAGVLLLREAGVPDAELDARLLLEYVCGTDYGYLFSHGGAEVDGARRAAYEECIGRRADRCPLQYITGEQEFMGLAFRVDERVLIPRQDTEILVETVWKTLKPGMSILDMCTGSGCILISLLHLAPECEGVGADISPAALEVAGENGRRLLPGAEGKRLSWRQSDLFERTAGRFDVIVSNPPYIPTGGIAGLMPEVREHEPVSALDGTGDGLGFYRRIAAGAGARLKEGGRLFLETGFDQAAGVVRLLEQNGFDKVEVTRDYAGLDRVVSAGWRAAGEKAAAGV